MNSRMKSPIFVLPGVVEALAALGTSTKEAGVPRTTIELVNLRASQINGCSVCVDIHWRSLKKLGESDERIASVGAWREATYFTDAERAALALCEAATRLSDRSDPVPDAMWNEAARYYNEEGLAALVLAIGVINLWNRVNATTKQLSGAWTARYA